MKVLVTGGAGFIGSHIVDKLILAGWNVFVVDNLSTGLEGNLNPKAKFYKVDIRSSEFRQLCKDINFDYIIHQAAQTMVPKSLEAPHYDSDVNIQGTINVLEACRETGVRRVVFASSAAVYGDITSVPITENFNTQPTSFYGLSKLVAEKYLALYHKLFGLNYVVLRYANVYGERQGDAGEGGVVSIFTKKIFNDLPLVIYGDGTQTRDFVYVGDVASANIKALTSQERNRVYNIGTGTEVTIQWLAETLTRIAGKEVEKSYLPAREGDIYRSSLDNATAVRELCWNPESSLEAGLIRTYNALIR